MDGRKVKVTQCEGDYMREVPLYKGVGSFTIIQSDNLLSVSLSSKDFASGGISEASLMKLPELGFYKTHYFYNRLFVNPKFRNSGYGRQLYDKTCEILDSLNEVLVIQVNPYGDLDDAQLRDFYKKNIYCNQGSFEETPEGLIIRRKG